MISERVRDNMIQNARRGSWNGGQKAYVYDWDDEQKLLVPNDNAKWVLLIFEEYALNPGANRIRNILYQEAIPSPSGGKWWAPTTIRYILRNHVYVGKIEYAGQIVDGKHQPIVPQDLFDRVQHLLGKNSEMAPRSRDSQHLLSGLLVCPYCGRHLQARFNGQKRIRRYVCYTRINMGIHECKCKILDADSLETEIVRIMLMLGESIEYFEEAKQALKEIAAAAEEERPVAEKIEKEKRLKKVRAAMKDLFKDYYEEKIIPREQFIEINKQYLEEEKQLVNYLEKFDQVDNHFTAQAADLDLLQSQLSALKTAWPVMTFEEKKMALRDMVKSIIPHDDHVELDIFYRKIEIVPQKNTETTMSF